MKKAGKNADKNIGGSAVLAKQVEAAAEKIVLSVLPKISTDGLLELWDVIFEKDGALYYLKIHVYKRRVSESPVTASLDSDLCERLTELLNTALDEGLGSLADRIDVLEVGSPGVTRRLRKEWHFTAVSALDAGTVSAFKTERVSRKRVLINRKGNYMSGVLEKFEADSGVVVLQSGERFALDESVVTLDYDLEAAPADESAEEISETGEGEMYE